MTRRPCGRKMSERCDTHRSECRNMAECPGCLGRRCQRCEAAAKALESLAREARTCARITAHRPEASGAYTAIGNEAMNRARAFRGKPGRA